MSQRINQRINWKCFDFNVNLNVYILLSWLKTNLELVKWEINSNYTTKKLFRYRQSRTRLPKLSTHDPFTPEKFLPDYWWTGI